MTWALWLIIAIVLVALEFVTAGFVMILFAIGALVAAVVAAITDSLAIQVLVFTIVAFIAVIMGRPILHKYFEINKEVKKSTVDALIGVKGIVTSEISENNYGLVKVNGDTWSAASFEGNTLSVGTEVIVNSVDGVKLVVSQK